MIARIVLTLMRTDVPTLTEGQIAIVRVTVDGLRTDPERLSGLLNGQELLQANWSHARTRYPRLGRLLGLSGQCHYSASYDGLRSITGKRRHSGCRTPGSLSHVGAEAPAHVTGPGRASAVIPGRPTRGRDLRVRHG